MNELRELPMLMKPDMIRATNMDIKTESRRLTGLEEVNKNPEEWKHYYTGEFIDDVAQAWVMFKNTNDPNRTLEVKCPYGSVNDLIYVRESWQKDGSGGFIYVSDYTAYESMRWRPNIHLPKFASRTWLQIISIGIERLWDITDEAAIAEGIEVLKPWPEAPDKKRYRWYGRNTDMATNDPVVSFNTLWVSINGSENFKINPWVWVIKYQVLSKTGKPEIHLGKEVANA